MMSVLGSTDAEISLFWFQSIKNVSLDQMLARSGQTRMAKSGDSNCKNQLRITIFEMLIICDGHQLSELMLHLSNEY